MKNKTTSLTTEAEHEETGPQSAAASRQPPCVWPRDSIIEDYVVLARRYSEAEDQVLAGSFLPVISVLLARNVYINFGRRMFPNLYCILVSPTGMRKTTTLQLVTHIARNLLAKRGFRAWRHEQPGALPRIGSAGQAMVDRRRCHPGELGA